MANTIRVSVDRINESLHKEPHFTVEAKEVEVNGDGRLIIISEVTSQVLSAASWGNVKVTGLS